MDTTTAYTELDRLIEQEQNQPVQIFPHSTRELAALYGISNYTVHTHLRRRGLSYNGTNWVYRSISEREHE